MGYGLMIYFTLPNLKAKSMKASLNFTVYCLLMAFCFVSCNPSANQSADQKGDTVVVVSPRSYANLLKNPNARVDPLRGRAVPDFDALAKAQEMLDYQDGLNFKKHKRKVVVPSMSFSFGIESLKNFVNAVDSAKLAGVRVLLYLKDYEVNNHKKKDTLMMDAILVPVNEDGSFVENLKGMVGGGPDPNNDADPCPSNCP